MKPTFITSHTRSDSDISSSMWIPTSSAHFWMYSFIIWGNMLPEPLVGQTKVVVKPSG